MKRKNWMIYLALSIAVAVMVVPFIWMLLTSFKTFEDSTRIPLQILPEIRRFWRCFLWHSGL